MKKIKLPHLTDKPRHIIFTDSLEGPDMRGGFLGAPLVSIVHDEAFFTELKEVASINS